MDLRSALFTTALATGVLMGAGLWSADKAVAGCIDVEFDQNLVFCDDDRTTTDTTYEIDTAADEDDDRRDRHYQFNAGGDVDVEVTPDGNITGFGLAVTSTEAGEPINAVHEGAISVNDGNNPTEGGTAVFNLTTAGGSISYTGDGSITDNDGGNDGLVIEVGPGAGLGIIQVGGAGSITGGHDGIVARQANNAPGTFGHVTIAGTGDTEGTDHIGILAEITGENNGGHVTVVRSGTVTGGFAGIVASTAGGGFVIVTVKDDVTATNGHGIITSAVDGLISVDLSGGTVRATEDGVIAISNGTGGISVNMTGGQIGTDADRVGGDGIRALSAAGATGGDINVHATTIFAQQFAVHAEIEDAANTGNINVDVADDAVLRGGVFAETAGTGDARVVIGDGADIVGNSPGSASVTAGGNAIQIIGNNAAVSGSSGVVVDQTNPAGTGVATVLVGNDSTIVGDGTDATDDYNGNGIFAGNQGTGLTSVITGNGTSVTGDANGIVAFQTNAANTNDINVSTGGPVRGEGNTAFVLSPYTDAFDAAGQPTTGLGIGVSNEGTGDINVNAGGSVFGANAGIQALASGTDIVISADSTVDSSAGNAIDAITSGAGAVTITTEQAVTGGINGIKGTSDTGPVTITANGPVTGNGEDGIQARSPGGNVTVTANAAISGADDGIEASGAVVTVTSNVSSIGGQHGIEANGGIITVNAHGTTRGINEDGIHARSTNQDITITTTGVVTGGDDGIDAVTGGDGNISIVANADITGDDDGIFARTASGNIAITGSGDITGTAGDGIDAASTAGGSINVNVTGAVTGDSGIVLSVVGAGTIDLITGGPVVGALDGINTSAEDGDTTIITNDTVTGGEDGIDATATGDGGITITSNADVTGGQSGISAVAEGAGLVTITTNGAVEGTLDDGILAVAGGHVTVTSNAEVSGGQDGIAAISTLDGNVTVTSQGVTGGNDGIRANAVGDGNVTVNAHGPVAAIDGDGIAAIAVGDGEVTVTANDDVTAGFDGIVAVAVGDGNVSVAAHGAVTGGNDGIRANAVGDGNVDVTANGPVVGTDGDGIAAVAIGTGNVVVSAQDDVTGGDSGIAAAAIGGGNIAVTTHGAVAGLDDDGIFTFAIGGDTSIIANGPVFGEVDGIHAEALGDGAISILAHGPVDAATGDGILTEAVDGDTTITANTLITAGDTGVNATTEGTGFIVAITGLIGTPVAPVGGDGIRLISTDTATGGDLAAVGNAIFAQGHGIHAEIFNAANDANIIATVGEDGIVDSGEGAVLVRTAGTGDVNVVLLNGATLLGGVHAQSETGNASVTAQNDVTIIGNSPGSAAITAGGDATQSFGNNAFVIGSSGIVVDQTSPAGTGVATVQVGTDGFIIGDGTDPADDYNGNGIFAGNQGTGLTSVMTGDGTSVIGEANGIVAFQTNAANTNDMTVTALGPVIGLGDVPFVLAPYTDAFAAAGLPTTGLGIGVSNAGTGDVTVTAGDTVFGENSGIQVLASGGAITITSVDVAGGVDGIIAITEGDGNITVTSDGAVEGILGDGILTSAVDGDTTITANARVTGGEDGIHAVATGVGDIAIVANAGIEGIAGDGILTEAVDGDTLIAANARVTGGEDGIHAIATGIGDIAIAANAPVRGVAGDGILTEAVDGDTGIAANARVTGGEDGIHAIATGIGDIAIAANGPVRGLAGDGIVTEAVDGDTAIAVNDTVFGEVDGIHAITTGTGDIEMVTNARIRGNTGDGILTFNAAGDTEIMANARVRGAEDGIHAIAGASGDIAIQANAPVIGEAGDGILTEAVDGDTEIAANARVRGGEDGIHAIATGAGDIDIGVASGVRVTGTTGSGVVMEANTGEATLENRGLIRGAFAAIRGATENLLQIVNHAGGVIRNLSGERDDLAISVAGSGATEIDNDGRIVGRIRTGAGDDTFTNTGLWATRGVSNFGAGNDTLINEGLIDVANQTGVAEFTRFRNLDSFMHESTGVIDMVDNNAPGVRDRLRIDGTYTGVPGSLVRMDLALTLDRNPHTDSDLLILDPANPADGTTDLVFNIVSTGVTATTRNDGRVLFANGQLLDAPVTVVRNRGDLETSSELESVPLARSGLVNYDLENSAPSGGNMHVVSRLDEDLAGGILLPIPATLAAVAFTTQKSPNPITATCIDPAVKPNAQAGWARGFGGDIRTDQDGKAVSDSGAVSRLSTRNRTTFRTIQGGLDHVMCDFDGHGGNFHFGVTVGQTWGESRQTNVGPGLFGTDVDFDSFFIGPYAAYTRGGLAILSALRFDHHSLELTNPTPGVDAFGIDIKASTISGSAAVSYEIPISQFNLVPEIGVNVSNTKVDDFEIAGANVALDDLWSVMGHAGVTGRTTLAVNDNVFAIPFASGTIFHEFNEEADAVLTIGPGKVRATGNRVGTFGQIGAGMNVVRVGDVAAGVPTVFGGARADLQFGDRIQGFTATVFGRVQF